MTNDRRNIERIFNGKAKAITPEKLDRLKEHFAGYAFEASKTGPYDVMTFKRGRQFRRFLIRARPA